ncbi:MAG: hypothetical protein HXO60_05560 [Rothia mucilaginosa]|uniref:hypothetical protein n=1 Tax=Rothia mucilaginosa TaxID=43675 RepID=UPI001CAF91B0|nr:hypothetical protein [Rothia mucilaginosa]MBF1651958.1 hypothetical protein [Rothia mucilaginosa]
MSQLPQNNEDFDYSPEYAKLYQGNDSQPSDANDMDEWPQPASEQPFDVQREQAGKRAANSSLLCGFLTPLTFFLGCWLIFHDLGESGLRVVFVAPVLNVLGIWLGFAARRRGTRAIGGLILNGLELCIFIGIVVLVTSLLNALSGIH